MTKSKPRILKDYEKLSNDLKEQIKLQYVDGYSQHLISYTNKEGKLISALPFETEEMYYLIKMTRGEAQQIVEDDDDFDDTGLLKEDAKETYEEKHTDYDLDEEEEPGYDQPMNFDEGAEDDD
ncbi:MAG: hypothetical protein PHU27_00130 [Salinivirgaceae bacterium]|nr:hypothetical protein [Salinivirgaceae bacterium]MDD4746040.1 hypothetical protein [Salinivirgaceae bacterium]MDY0281594.1 hypothetical protein [Salinivirgaceae bacterium]